MTPPPAQAPRPYDERLRALGDQVVQRFLALIRVGRSYEVGNQVFRIQLEHFLDSLRPVFDDADAAVLVALDNDLYLNGIRIPVRNQTFKSHELLREEFARRRIAGLRMTSDIRSVDVERFFALFLRPGDHHGAGLLEACLAEGLDAILPAVHATTAVPDTAIHAGGDPLSPASALETGEGRETGPPTAPGEPGDAPRGAVPKSFLAAVAGARTLLMTTALHDAIEMRHAKRVVQPLVDAACSEQPVVLGLSSMGHHDEYTYMHAVNVGMVAVTIGHVLGLDRAVLADLGVAALLHDVGKTAVGDQVKHPIAEWTPEERAAAERHTIEGARQLARSTVLNATTLRCMRAALEHHAGPGGYPRLDAWTPSALSQIIAVADCYVNLLSHRSPAGQRVTPNQAIGMMLGPLASRFEPALLWGLVKSVGLFPPGQMVELSDGGKAVVLAPNRADLLRPHVRVVTNPEGEWLAESDRVDHRPLPPGLSVRYALRAEDYPTAPDTLAA